MHRRFLTPLAPRDPAEPHRAATPLELFFDLVIVVAVAAVTETLHHAIAHGDGLAMLPRFVFLFLAIWWAWMNFTWFASSFGREDPLYRLLVFVILAGAVLFAGGAARIMETMDFRYGLLGWIGMRVGMVGLWMRAARGTPHLHRTAWAYAGGITLAQLGWIALYVFTRPGSPAFYAVGIACFVLEWSVPVVAERQGRTPWHRGHIVERYGLLTIIVLGEMLVSVARAFGMLYTDNATPAVAVPALAGLVIVFALFWIYFADEAHLPKDTFRHVFGWGYGHVLFFGAVAVLGAGLAAETDVVAHTAHVAAGAVAPFVGGALGLALAMLWAVRDRYHALGVRGAALPVAAVVAVGLGVAGAPAWAFAALMAATLLVRIPMRTAVPAAVAPAIAPAAGPHV